MKTKLLSILALGVMLAILIFVAAPTQRAFADTTVTVSPQTPNGWFFYDDDFPGGVGNFVTGPATPPLGTGSAHYYLPPGSNARQALTTLAFEGTRLSQITNLQYSTYRSQLPTGNETIYLQFDVDFNAADGNFAYQGRLTYLPFTVGPIPQNTWQTWNPMTQGTWYASRSGTNFPGGSGGLCSQGSPCTWAQILSNWPNAGIMVNTGWLHLKAGGPADGFDGNVDAFTIGIGGTNTTYDFENGNTTLAFVPETAGVGVGNTTYIGINTNNVTNMYGFQFQVNYDATKVNATGVWADNFAPQFRFFRTNSPAAIPSGWNANCSAGVCKFAVSHVAPQTAVTGSGPVAIVALTGTNPGTFNLTFTGDILSDADGLPITHNINTSAITVYGTTTVSGVVALQGRATPIDSGTVLLTDTSGNLPTLITTFNASTGAYSFSNVPAAGGGTSYQFDAVHSLYLGNRQTQTLSVGVPYTAPTTTLKGGDADNSGLIDISDLTCIGSTFGNTVPPPAPCGLQGGSANINADGFINILDLVLTGGNYGLATPRPW